MPIRRLDPGLVNKIAAGEVIERPASVVKELVENALDAGAKRVVVESEEGGRKLIRISDDGCGIPAAELPLAFESHATSKIATIDDLFSVRSLGFRGEALASIAAVSHLRLASRPRKTHEGAELEARGGELGEVRAAGTPPGTVAEVRNLFFNVPVRRKFLRSVGVEQGHIAETVTRFALARSDVRFELHHDGRREFALPSAGGPRPRIAHFFGEELAKALIEVRDAGQGTLDRFTALLAPPSFARPNAKQQYVFLNGRFIRDRVLTHAFAQAYRELVMSGRHPVVFLYLDLPPEEVDVNVHPTKIEVRFRRHWQLHDGLVAAMREGLTSANLMPAVPVGGPPLPSPPPFDPARVQGAIVDFFARQGGSAGGMGGPGGAGTRGSWEAGTAGSSAGAAPGAPGGEFPSSQSAIRGRRWQIHASYIVEEVGDGVVIVDQHALHERVRLEQLRREWQRAALPRQRLLVPAVVELPPKDLARLEEARPALESFGVEWEDFGANTVVIRTVPDVLRSMDPARMLREFLDFADEHFERPADAAAAAGKEASAGLVDHVLHFLACRSAVKAGDPLAPEEIDALLAERDRLENAATCAHGRPVALKMTLGDLERYFKRK